MNVAENQSRLVKTNSYNNPGSFTQTQLQPRHNQYYTQETNHTVFHVHTVPSSNIMSQQRRSHPWEGTNALSKTVSDSGKQNNPHTEWLRRNNKVGKRFLAGLQKSSVHQSFMEINQHNNVNVCHYFYPKEGVPPPLVKGTSPLLFKSVFEKLDWLVQP